MSTAARVLLAALLLLPTIVAARPDRPATGPARCLRASGDAARRCFAAWTEALRECRLGTAAASCEAAARADGGALPRALAAVEAPIADACSDADAEPLGYRDAADVALRVHEACADWGDDLTTHAIADGDSATGALLGCRRETARRLGRLANVVADIVAGCDERAFRGEGCRHAARDRRIDTLVARLRARLARRCGDRFDALGLGTLDEAIAAAVTRARHFALHTSPPNDLGPTAAFGPYRAGVRTIALVDPSRTAVGGQGPRPVTVEVYYPTTPEAVAGLPRDVVTVLGLAVAETPAYRDAAVAPGRFPLVLFSHGSNGVRFQSVSFAVHLASHGYVVVSPDHHGNTFIDTASGIVDADGATNRPRDLVFLLDTFTAPGGPLAASIDPERIAASGHSFGGFTVLELVGGPERDPRVDAILPQAPLARVFDAAFLGGIDVPVLFVGGSIDETTPFAEDQARPYADVAAVPPFTGLAELENAGHFTFSDFCEVPRQLLAFLGGFDEACEPRHLPWRHAHDLVNYLALNFFDAVLRDDAEALARLDPAVVNGLDGVTLQRK